MRYLTLAEVLELHRLLAEQSGGAEGLRDLGGFESALAQPRMTFDEKELYPTIEEKGTALCFFNPRQSRRRFVPGNVCENISQILLGCRRVERFHY